MRRSKRTWYSQREGRCSNAISAEDALDAVQDSFISFLRLPEARGIARAEEDALKLLTVILRHNVQNQLPKRGRHSRARALLEVEAVRAEPGDSEALIASAEDLARARGCILRMARLQRQVILLSLLDEAPREPLGTLLGVSESYARVLLHRARQHVRNCELDLDADPLAD